MCLQTCGCVVSGGKEGPKKLHQETQRQMIETQMPVHPGTKVTRNQTVYSCALPDVMLFGSMNAM